MVDYKYKDLFQNDSVDKKLTIITDDKTVTITNTELHSQQFELNESLCSESELRFGCCEASSIKFKISNVFTSMKDKWLNVSMVLDGHTDEPFQIGRYKVYSDVPTADRRYRDAVAYDAMYDIINANVTDWYNTILPDKDSTVTMKQFRTSFIQHFGLEQEEIDLVNDSMTVEKTIEPSEISGRDVITAICEINACFGHINRNGKFQYIYLEQDIQGLYPRNDLYPADDLYPRDPKSTRIGKGLYISCSYEDYLVKTINKLQIRQEENDIGYIHGSGDNCYIIEDNFLVYGKGTEQLKVIGENLYGKITGIIYRPFEADVKGNLCFEVGDAVRLTTRYEIVESYILSRTLKGVQALRDSFSAEGEAEYSEKVNSVQKSIVQLKGKTNVLERTIEETRSVLEDKDEKLQSQITQNAESIEAEVSRAKGTEQELSSRITQTATEIRSEVNDVNNRLQSQITQNANNITLKVSKDNVISEINQSAEKITIKAAKIDLQGLVSATEFTSKYATISSLNAVNAKVQSLEADHVTVNSFNAVNARVHNLEIDHVSINDFNAANARINTIESNYISASTVKAQYMEVANWTSAGYIRADRISAETIISTISSVDVINVSAIGIRGYMYYKGVVAAWRTRRIGDEIITYLGPEE